MSNKLTINLDALPATLPAELVEYALRIATDEQWASERGRRNSAARKTYAGGRPRKKVEADPTPPARS